MNKSIKNNILILAMGGIMSVVSLPSATTLTTVVGTTIASIALLNDAYAEKKVKKITKWELRKLKKPGSKVTTQKKTCSQGKLRGGYCIITPPPENGCPDDFPLQPGSNPPYCKGNATVTPDTPSKPTTPSTAPTTQTR